MAGKRCRVSVDGGGRLMDPRRAREGFRGRDGLVRVSGDEHTRTWRYRGTIDRVAGRDRVPGAKHRAPQRREGFVGGGGELAHDETRRGALAEPDDPLERPARRPHPTQGCQRLVPTARAGPVAAFAGPPRPHGHLVPGTHRHLVGCVDEEHPVTGILEAPDHGVEAGSKHLPVLSVTVQREDSHGARPRGRPGAPRSRSSLSPSSCAVFRRQPILRRHRTARKRGDTPGNTVRWRGRALHAASPRRSSRPSSSSWPPLRPQRARHLRRSVRWRWTPATRARHQPRRSTTRSSTAAPSCTRGTATAADP